MTIRRKFKLGGHSRRKYGMRPLRYGIEPRIAEIEVPMGPEKPIGTDSDSKELYHAHGYIFHKRREANPKKTGRDTNWAAERKGCIAREVRVSTYLRDDCKYRIKGQHFLDGVWEDVPEGEWNSDVQCTMSDVNKFRAALCKIANSWTGIKLQFKLVCTSFRDYHREGFLKSVVAARANKRAKAKHEV